MACPTVCKTSAGSGHGQYTAQGSERLRVDRGAYENKVWDAEALKLSIKAYTQYSPVHPLAVAGTHSQGRKRFIRIVLVGFGITAERRHPRSDNFASILFMHYRVAPTQFGRLRHSSFWHWPSTSALILFVCDGCQQQESTAKLICLIC